MDKLSQIFNGLFRKQITFSISAFLLAVGTLIFIIYASIFLLTELNKSITFDGEKISGVKFDIDGYEKLNLGK